MSNIQWTDVSSNPIHLIKEDGTHGGHWCRKVSEGCQNCYSEAQNQSGFFSFASHLKYEGEAPSNLVFDEEVCKKWLGWRKSKKIFVCSMTDLFGEWVKDEWIDKVFSYIAAAPWHTFQLLTKRPERAIAYFNRPSLSQRIMEAGNLVCKPELPLKNVWFGVTTENQGMADKRIPLLLQIPAAVRWLSVEPLLEQIDLSTVFGLYEYDEGKFALKVGSRWANSPDWVVIGGESGSGARPLPIEWIEGVSQQCQDAGIPVFIKQLGCFPVTNNPEKFAKKGKFYGEDCLMTAELIGYRDYLESYFVEARKMGLELEGMYRIKLKDRKGGNIEEFPEHLRIREFPDAQGGYRCGNLGHPL